MPARLDFAGVAAICKHAAPRAKVLVANEQVDVRRWPERGRSVTLTAEPRTFQRRERQPSVRRRPPESANVVGQALGTARDLARLPCDEVAEVIAKGASSDIYRLTLSGGEANFTLADADITALLGK